VLLAALLGSSCFHTLVRSSTPGLAMHESSRLGWNVAWGIVRADIDAPECHAGFAQVETWTPWWGFLIEAITLGILTPETAEYVCASPPQQAAAPYVVVPQQQAYPPAPAPQYPAYPPPPPAPVHQATPASLPPPPPPPPVR
jgi:hypothetical protein